MSPHNFYFIYLIHYIYVGLFTFCFLYVKCPLTPVPPPPPLQNMFRRLCKHHPPLDIARVT